MKAIEQLNGGINSILASFSKTNINSANKPSLFSGVWKALGIYKSERRDYNQLSSDEKDMLTQLINAAESLSIRIGVRIS